jgi:DHA1 family tetracycline resistance protein-like MFS transporter
MTQQSSFVLSQGLESMGCRWYRAHPAWTVPILFLSFAANIGPTPVLQTLANEFYGTQAQLISNMPQFIAGLCGFVTVPLIGALSDRYGRKPMLLMTLLGSAMPWMLMVIFDLSRDGERFKIFLLARALMGVFGDTSAAVGLCFTYMGDVVAPERRGSAGGLMMAFGAGAGFILAPNAFAWIYDEGARLQLTMLCVVTMMLLQVVYVGVIPESNPTQRRASLPGLDCSQLKPTRSFELLCGETSANQGLLRRLFATMFLCYLVKIGLVATMGIFAMQVYDFTTKENSSLSAVYGVVQALSQLALPLLLRGLSQRACVLLGLFCGFVAALIQAVPGAPGWTLFVCEAFLAVPYIVYTVLTTIAGRLVPPSKTGEASMMISSALTLSSAIGPLSFGALSSVTVTTSYPGCAFLLFVAVMGVAFVLALQLPSDECIRQLHDEAKATEAKLAPASTSA